MYPFSSRFLYSQNGSFDLFHLVCDYSFADIFFVLDSSGSEGSVDFHHQLDFVKLVVNQFQIGKDDTHVGVAKYSTGATLEISLR